MDEYGGQYAPRDIEVDIVDHVHAILTAQRPFSAAVVTGPRGYRSASILTEGVIPKLLTDPTFQAHQIHKEWHPQAPVQYCATVDDVPNRPPPADSNVKLLLFATPDFTEIPDWLMIQNGPEVRTFPVGPLTLIEAQALVEAQLGGSVEIASMHKLASLAGFIPAMLTTIIRECRDQGALEHINGYWQLLGDPVQIAIIPYLQAQIAAVDPVTARTLFRIALTGRISFNQLEDDETPIATMLLHAGELQRHQGGTIGFVAPIVKQGLQLLSPLDQQEAVYREALETGKADATAIQWAAQHDFPVSMRIVEETAHQALREHQWHDVATIAESTKRFPDRDLPGEKTYRHQIHLHAAYAARFLPDIELAHAHLDRAEQQLPALQPEIRDTHHTQITILRAELHHYHAGEPDTAIKLLTDATTSPHRAALLSHAVIHQVYAGNTTPALTAVEEHKTVLRQAPDPIRQRVSIATALAHTAAGQPQRALRSILMSATRQTTTANTYAWLTEDIRTSGLIAALNTNGPEAFPFLHRRMNDTRDGTYSPDLVTFYLTRASWEYARGAITEAHRLGEMALETSHYRDPSGVQAALTALVAETAALTGKHERALELHNEFFTLPPRASAVITGTMRAHLAAALLLLETPHTGSIMRDTALEFIAQHQYGFASDLLYAGVRFGRLRAATGLTSIAEKLDGPLHSMRVAHAKALVNKDPVALLEVSDAFKSVGSQLHAAETAAAATRLPNLPTSVKRRALDRVVEYIQQNPTCTHPLLCPVAEHAQPNVADLTPREHEIATLIETGLTNREIATRLSLSTRTVEGHVARIYRKADLARRPRGKARTEPRPARATPPH